MHGDREGNGGAAGVIAAAARFLGYINAPLIRVGGYTTIILLAVIVAVVGAGVWWRYVLNNSISWTEEVAKYLMVWMAFMGAPVALSQRGHVGIELFPESLPVRLRQLVYACIYLIVILVMIALTYYGFKLALNARIQTAAVVDISLFYVYLALPVGSAAMGLIGLQFFLQALAGTLGSTERYEAISDITDVPEHGQEG